ncbi:DHHC-type zinc finger family protein isoform 2 [Hibiscus syriacus]|uniref:DHHC-type zinc finger family protein isoform 2 n=1 Tax=Hibiscus syriacus TaxID=106335 RepID=A0A6A2XTI6_HIBSY|nr:DHHC-type zinc finger family protein isoform 2 [Hibiscus syriacus]
MPWNNHSHDSCFLPLWAVAYLPRDTHQLHPSFPRHFLKFVGTVFGDRGANLVLSVEYYCCDSANPILQIHSVYINMRMNRIDVGSVPALLKTSFSYIPGHYLSEVHRYASFLVVAIGVFLFLLTSFSDPGTVKTENVSQYLSAYPYDNLIFTKKECPIYLLDRSTTAYASDALPALIITVDGWHFLLFVYGAIAIGLILAGQVEELQITFKWQDYVSWRKKLNEAQAAFGVNATGMITEGKPQERKCKSFFGRFLLQETEVVARRNVYDKGFFHNI